MDIEDNILLIVGDPQGILDEQLRPHLSFINIIVIWINFIKLYIICFVQLGFFFYVWNGQQNFSSSLSF